jgi:hypothetical protein
MHFLASKKQFLCILILTHFFLRIYLLQLSFEELNLFLQYLCLSIFFFNFLLIPSGQILELSLLIFIWADLSARITRITLIFVALQRHFKLHLGALVHNFQTKIFVFFLTNSFIQFFLLIEIIFMLSFLRIYAFL